MRLALISDIHSNLEALDACFRAIDRARVDRVACLGDMVGYGASPNDCLDAIRRRVDHAIVGNHDAAVIDAAEAEYFNGDARAAVEWTRAGLTDENLAYLKSLPLTDRVGDDVLLVHAAPGDPAAWHYVFQGRDAEPEFEAFVERLCFNGHTHLPAFFVLRNGRVEHRSPPHYRLPEDARALVNVGSVGQPRDGDPRASFCIYDAAERSLEIMRVEYDIAQVQDRIFGTELPRSGAERLVWGV